MKIKQVHIMWKEYKDEKQICPWNQGACSLKAEKHNSEAKSVLSEVGPNGLIVIAIADPLHSQPHHVYLLQVESLLEAIYSPILQIGKAKSREIL